MTKKLLLTACAAALLGNGAWADDDKAHADLSSWDADSNKMVSQEEWADTIDEQGLFDNIDENNNGIFDVEESVDTVLDYDLSMDIDDGGHIDRHEFAIGLYDRYDANDDDALDETEFGEFASNTEASPLWMTDEAETSDN